MRAVAIAIMQVTESLCIVHAEARDATCFLVLKGRWTR